MADQAVKFPSARQDVYYVDAQTGKPVFTRPWFLFFQSLWLRQGGAIGPSISDLDGSLFEDAGTSETNATLFQLSQDLMQQPAVQQLVEQQGTLQAELAEARDQIAELWKAIQSLNQSSVI